jgi:hypothetical protein
MSSSKGSIKRRYRDSGMEIKLEERPKDVKGRSLTSFGAGASSFLSTLLIAV